MIKLKNIKMNSPVIECDILPEDSSIVGHIVVDIKSGSFESCFLPEGYEWCKNHANHARRALVKIAAEKEIPSEKLVMWC